MIAISITQKPAPIVAAPVSKPRGVRITVNPMNDFTTDDYDEWYQAFVFYRYTTSVDAAAHTNATLVKEVDDFSILDTAELTKGLRYWYRVGMRTIYGDISALSTAQSVVYRGVSSDDSNMTDPNSYAENSDLSLGPDIGWSDPATVISDVANAFAGTYVIKRAYTGVAASYVNRNSLIFAVRVGEQYQFGGMSKTDGSWAGAGYGWRLSALNASKVEIATSPLAGGIGVTTSWFEQSLLYTVPAGVAFLRLEYASYSQTAGTAFGSHGYIRPAVTDVMTDKTPPGTPTSLAVTQLTKDTDGGDGRVRINARATWNAPASGGTVRRYIIEINDGENVEVRYAPAARRYIKIKDMVVGRTYNVQVSAESFAGVEGAQTTAVPCTPTGKTAVPGDVTSVAIVVKAGFQRIKWTAPSDRDILGYNVYVNTVSNPATATLVDFTQATKYDDTTARTVGTGYYYYVETVNRSGIPATNRVAASNNPQTYRQTINADIDGQLDTAKLPNDLDTTNIVKNSSFKGGLFNGWYNQGGFYSTALRSAASPVAGAPAPYVAVVTGAGVQRIMWVGNPPNIIDAFEVSPLETFVGRAWVAASALATAGEVRLTARFGNASGDGSYTYIAFFIATLSTLASGGAWVEFKGQVVAPALVNSLPTSHMVLYIENNAAHVAGVAGITKVRVRRATDEDMADQSAPAQPAAAPTMSVVTGDFDKDGKMDNGFFMNLPAIAVGTIPVRYWEIEHQVATAQGSSGSMTGYAKRRENALIKAEPSGTTYYQYECLANRWHKTRYRGISFTGKEGAWSVYQNLGAQPTTYDGMTGTTPATPTAIAYSNGIEVTWTKPAGNPTYSHTELYQGATLIYTGSATKWLDKTVRTVGAGYTYTIKHYDTAGNVSNSSLASASVNYRQMTTAEVQDLAIVPIKADLGDTSSLVKANKMDDVLLFTTSVTGSVTSVVVTSTPNLTSLVGKAINKLQASATFASSGNILFLKTTPINTCQAGKRYNFEAYVDITGLSASNMNIYISVDWYGIDGSGNKVFISNTSPGAAIFAQNVASPTAYLTAAQVAPAGAAFFAMGVKFLANGALIAALEAGGFNAFENNFTIIEALEFALPETVAAGNTKIFCEMNSNHTTSARFVRFAFSMKNSVGGARTFTAELLKIDDPGTTRTITVLRSYQFTLGDNEVWYQEFFDTPTVGKALTGYAVRLTAGGAGLDMNNRYMMTDARLG